MGAITIDVVDDGCIWILSWQINALICAVRDNNHDAVLCASSVRPREQRDEYKKEVE